MVTQSIFVCKNVAAENPNEKISSTTQTRFYNGESDDSPEQIGHIGGVRGTSSVLKYWPGSGYCVIVLSNERFRAHAVGNYLAYLISSLEE